MLPMATISKLVKLADDRCDKSEGFSTGKAHPHHGTAEYKRRGKVVWAVENMDGTYYLWHYGTLIMTAERGYKSSQWTPVVCTECLGAGSVFNGESDLPCPDPDCHDGHIMLRLPVEVPGKFEVHEPSKGISVSDQQGMNALLKVLGISGYVSREGNTADYGGLGGRR